MYHIARQGLHQLCEQSSLLLRIHTAKNTECYIRMKLVAHDNTVPLIRLLWLKNPIRTVQKRVSESCGWALLVWYSGQKNVTTGWFDVRVPQNGFLAHSGWLRKYLDYMPRVGPSNFSYYQWHKKCQLFNSYFIFLLSARYKRRVRIQLKKRGRVSHASPNLIEIRRLW